MGELRLYALGVAEVRGIIGARPELAADLRAAAQQAFPPPPQPKVTGLIHRLGPIFRRPPGTPVRLPTDPEPHDVEVLLTGGYVAPERTGATWRVLEALVHYRSWSSIRLPLDPQLLEDLDFALARGGVSAAGGIGHLLTTSLELPLLGVSGLSVGWHRYDRALAMASAYRAAMPGGGPGQQGGLEQQGPLIADLANWLDGFPHWAKVAASLGRPIPDLIGFWAH